MNKTAFLKGYINKTAAGGAGDQVAHTIVEAGHGAEVIKHGKHAKTGAGATAGKASIGETVASTVGNFGDTADLAKAKGSLVSRVAGGKPIQDTWTAPEQNPYQIKGKAATAASTKGQLGSAFDKLKTGQGYANPNAKNLKFNIKNTSQLNQTMKPMGTQPASRFAQTMTNVSNKVEATKPMQGLRNVQGTIAQSKPVQALKNAADWVGKTKVGGGTKAVGGKLLEAADRGAPYLLGAQALGGGWKNVIDPTELNSRLDRAKALANKGRYDEAFREGTGFMDEASVANMQGIMRDAWDWDKQSLLNNPASNTVKLGLAGLGEAAELITSPITIGMPTMTGMNRAEEVGRGIQSFFPYDETKDFLNRNPKLKARRENIQRSSDLAGQEDWQGPTADYMKDAYLSGDTKRIKDAEDLMTQEKTRRTEEFTTNLDARNKQEVEAGTRYDYGGKYDPGTQQNLVDSDQLWKAHPETMQKWQKYHMKRGGHGKMTASMMKNYTDTIAARKTDPDKFKKWDDYHAKQGNKGQATLMDIKQYQTDIERKKQQDMDDAIGN